MQDLRPTPMGPPSYITFLTVLGDTPSGLAPIGHPKVMQREVRRSELCLVI